MAIPMDIKSSPPESWPMVPAKKRTSALPSGPLSTYKFREVDSHLVVAFGSCDPENPVNWPKRRKYLVVLMGIMTVLNSTLGSSLPSGAISYIAKDFHIVSQEELALPISLFLLGYVFGPLLCGPLSEYCGRKPVTVVSFVGFMILTLGCAVCRDWKSLLVLRFLVGITASAPISIVGGILADIYDDPRERGVIMSYCMTATTVGPVIGPVITGYISVIGWRWSFWIGLIVAVLTLPIVILSPETYEPVLLRNRARRLRKETGIDNIASPIELENRGVRQMITVALARPFRMLIHESIVLFCCLYLSLVYAIFFLYFQTYPIIFQGIYGMTTGMAGLMYLPIGVGAVIALVINLWWDSYLFNAKIRGATWAYVEEYRRLPLACIGGPLYVVSLMWLGWTSTDRIHWSVPMMSGVVFGAGFLLVFMAILNYLGDAYEKLSASAHSASGCMRSLFGAGLPIAAAPMFNKLGTAWACSLLAFVSLGMTAIPFIFIKYGERIRANSKFCLYLRRMKEQRILEEQPGGSTTLESLASSLPPYSPSSPSIASSSATVIEDDGDWGIRLKSPPELPQFGFEAIQPWDDIQYISPLSWSAFEPRSPV